MGFGVQAPECRSTPSAKVGVFSSPPVTVLSPRIRLFPLRRTTEIAFFVWILEAVLLPQEVPLRRLIRPPLPVVMQTRAQAANSYFPTSRVRTHMSFYT